MSHDELPIFNDTQELDSDSENKNIENSDKERIKQELSGMKLYEEGMPYCLMKQILEVIKESTEMAEKSSEKRNSNLVKGGSSKNSTNDQPKSTIFDSVLDTSSDADEVNIKTEREDPLDEPSKINPLACPIVRPNEKLEDIFKRIILSKFQEREKEAPYDKEEYERWMRKERRYLEKASFRQKYSDKLEAGYDFTEIKWGSPIKTRETYNSEEQPGCSFLPEEDTFRNVKNERVVKSPSSSRLDRATKRKANLNIIKCMSAEKDTVFVEDADRNIDTYMFDENSEDSSGPVFQSVKKRKKSMKKNSNNVAKEQKKNPDSTKKQETKKSFTGKRKLFNIKQIDEDFVMDFEEIAQEAVEKEKNEVEFLEEIKKETENKGARKNSFATRVEQQKLWLKQQDLDEKDKEKKKKEAELKKENMEKLQREELIKKRQIEKEKMEKIEKEKQESRNFNTNYWRELLNNSKQSNYNRDNVYSTRSTHTLSVKENFLCDDENEEQVNCPICNEKFSKSQIEEHFNKCHHENFVIID